MSAYTILPFRFLHFNQDEILITSEVGEFAFLTNQEFKAFVNYKLCKQQEIFLELESKHFLCTDNLDNVIKLIATKYRTKKAFLKDFTSLHMVVPTLRCNSSCIYCQVARKKLDDNKYNMSKKTADLVVKTIFKSPAPNIKIEFQGGDPVANFALVRYIIERAKLLNIIKHKELEFVICTNTILLTKEQIKYLKQNKVLISTSLDGPHDLHLLHRPLQNKQDSYNLLIEKTKLIRTIYGDDYCISALMTSTKFSLGRFKEIVDEYLAQGYNNIFLRSLNPYGFAKNYKEKVAYKIDDFIKNFIEALNYIIELNKQGTFFIEGYTALLLRRILTPFATGFVDLQSPAGAGIACAIYDYDGSVYMSDEGRMMARFKNDFFKIGNVHANTYQEMFNGQKIKEVLKASCVEILPGCATCAYAPYCGADPVRNMSEQGSLYGFRPTNEMCKKNKALFNYIFSLIKSNDPKINQIFWTWIK